MTDNVIPLKEKITHQKEIVSALREVADRIESQNIPVKTLVIIVENQETTSFWVRFFGYIPRQAARLGILEFAKFTEMDGEKGVDLGEL